MWLAVMSSVAAAQSAESAAPAIDLEVKPLLCIVDHRTPACDIAFLVSWQSDRSGDFCLLNDFAAEPLTCWKEEQTGEYTEQRTVRDAFRYWMTAGGTDTELAAVTVEVLRIADDDRRRRRRSRHVWDVL